MSNCVLLEPATGVIAVMLMKPWGPLNAKMKFQRVSHHSKRPREAMTFLAAITSLKAFGSSEAELD